jgi:hypothetical protein
MEWSIRMFIKNGGEIDREDHQATNWDQKLRDTAGYMRDGWSEGEARIKFPVCDSGAKLPRDQYQGSMHARKVAGS